MSQAELNKAAEDVKKLTKRSSTDELLRLYDLYKLNSLFKNSLQNTFFFISISI